MARHFSLKCISAGQQGRDWKRRIVLVDQQPRANPRPRWLSPIADNDHFSHARSAVKASRATTNRVNFASWGQSRASRHALHNAGVIFQDAKMTS